ncbi:MAG: hypothetical protein JNL82_38205 [Myxococcales bacterium]|nr:hypothetical protein [Myxococcales bacterium]
MPPAPPASPVQLLSDLFLRMLSADDMRRMATYAFPGNLERSLPGPTSSPLQHADALATEIVHHDALAYLWPYLLKIRPLRRLEIQSARETLERTPRSAD